MIYFLEDDNSIRELVVYTMNSTGFEAVGFGKPGEFWAAMERETPSLVCPYHRIKTHDRNQNRCRC